ncbi:hypothetical protein Ancab_020906 [Ancistrocladus abbreviatus]
MEVKTANTGEGDGDFIAGVGTGDTDFPNRSTLSTITTRVLSSKTLEILKEWTRMWRITSSPEEVAVMSYFLASEVAEWRFCPLWREMGEERGRRWWAKGFGWERAAGGRGMFCFF